MVLEGEHRAGTERYTICPIPAPVPMPMPLLASHTAPLYTKQEHWC